MSSFVMSGIECTCLAFLLVIMTAYIILPRSSRLSRDGFFFCLVSLILGLLFDMISWVCECGPSLGWIQYSSNTLCLVASGFINSFFAYYIIGLIREKKPVSMLYARIIAIINILGSVSIIVAAFCGNLFDIIQSPADPEIMIYNAGGFLYNIPNYLSALSLTVLFIIVLLNARSLGRNRLIVFSIYFLLPMFSACLELVFDDLQLSYPVTAICVSIIYAMVQSNHLNELMLREELLNEWSYVDPLTNLLNRRAFERTIEEASDDADVNVAYFDLNGLKRINDMDGHHAGDRYLTDFSNTLIKYFSHDDVYRVSGDEFVVIARSTETKKFNDLILDLRNEICADMPVASLGTASGPGSDTIKLIKDAEIKMYLEKEDFYKKHPDYSRRNI